MNKEHFSLVYFSTRPLFLGIAYSLLFNQTGSDTILSCLIGTILGCILILFINKMKFTKENFKLIQLIIYIYFLILATMVLEAFISSFFLTTTPKLLIIAPSLLLCLYASKKKMSSIKRTTFLLFFLSIVIFFIAASSLSNFFKFSNLLPFFTSRPINIIKSSLIFATLSAAPNVLLKEENIKLSTHLTSFIFTCLVHTIACIIILGALTPNVAKMYSFPEYMILKRIKIFTFIENIENILSSIWYIDTFVFITLTLKRINSIIKKDIYFYPLVIFVVLFTTYFIVDNYFRVIFLYQYTPIILLVLLLSLGTSTLKKS